MLKEIEVEEEKKHCFANKNIKMILNSIAGKKRIIITSDMYLDVGVIEEILSKVGITSYDKLYLSSEYKSTKKSSELFNIIVEEERVEPNKIVHIGDNPFADYFSAKRSGLQAILLH